MNRERLANYAMNASAIPLAGATGYAVYDWNPQEGEGANVGEGALNALYAQTPIFGTMGGAAAGYGLEAAGNYVARRFGRKVPDLNPATSLGAGVGGLLGTSAASAYAIGGMRDRDEQGITSNIPMQEIQELNDLLGANGAYY